MSDSLTPERVRKMRNALRLEVPDPVWQDVAPVFDMLEDILRDIDIYRLRRDVRERQQAWDIRGNIPENIGTDHSIWQAAVGLVALFDHHQIVVASPDWSEG